MSAILIVDDHEENRYLLRAMLAASGHEVAEAANGAEALAQARRSQPDVIVSDILMPQMDGFVLCRECKRDEQLRDIPFLFYTATYTDPRDEALALQLGAARFIVKPVESEEFVAILREVLQAPAAGRPTAPPAGPPAAPPPTPEEETAFYRLYNEALIRKLEDKSLDLERLNRSLAESEERFRRLAENAPDMIYRYEFAPRRGFTYVSPAAAIVTGYTPEEHYADPDLGFKIVHPDDRPLLEAAARGETAPGQPLALRWVRKDGQVVWTEQRNVPVYDEAGKLVALEGIARDITERKRAAEELAEREARFRTLFESTPVGIGVADMQGNLLAFNEAMLAPGGYNRQEAIQIGNVAAFYADPEQHETALATLQKQGSLKDYEVKFKRKDGTAYDALLSLTHVTLNGRPALQAVVQDITERKQREREMQAVVGVSATLRTAQTRAQITGGLLDQLLLLFHANSAGVATVQPDGSVVVEAARGEFATAVGLRLAVGEGLVGRVVATGETYLGNAPGSEALFARPGLPESLKTLACAPLVVQGQALGALWIGSPETFEATDLRVLDAIADIAANALQRTNLHEQTQQQVEQLTALREIDQTITASIDLRMILKVILEHVAAQLNVDAAAVLLLNRHSLRLEFAAGHGFRTRDIERASLRLGEGRAGRAALERQALGIPDLTADTGFVRRQWVNSEDFVAYRVTPLIAKGEVKGVLEVFRRSLFDPSPSWLNFFDTLAGQAAIAIDNAQLFDSLQRSHLELSLGYDATIEGWSRVLDLRDKEIEGHSRRVAELTLRLARAAGLTEDELIHVRRGALLHDIGKMGVPDAILLKPGPLTEDEWEIMCRHPAYAYEMLSPINYLRRALDIPYCHHEKWDGTGYPRGLKGEQIPLAARLFAVADVWDALGSDRPYRPAWPAGKALEYIRTQAGEHFDPQIVDLFFRVTGEKAQDHTLRAG